MAFLVVAYAVSPVDLIPDFIPVVGYLDDLVLVPLGIVLARRLLPDHVLAECRSIARERAAEPRTQAGIALVVAGWLLLAALGWVVWSASRSR